MQAGDDGQAPGEFRDQSEFEQVGRFDAGVQAFEDVLVVAACGRYETEGVGLGQDVVEPDEGAAADEQDVRRVDVPAVLQADRRALHDLEQRMLDAFARGGVGLAADGLELVDLVDEDDAALGPLQVAIGPIDEAVQDGLDFVADKLCLGQ